MPHRLLPLQVVCDLAAGVDVFHAVTSVPLAAVAYASRVTLHLRAAAIALLTGAAVAGCCCLTAMSPCENFVAATWLAPKSILFKEGLIAPKYFIRVIKYQNMKLSSF
ncbi:conserved hypothetical protein [Ricinus communis]|uniref:Uncharacterized protein n=1 Tax=Ricinus communis TaxID=3988 RepID=B9S0U1_RICCO|nr:conserved hypothetical protein [Ricinus communis]